MTNFFPHFLHSPKIIFHTNWIIEKCFLLSSSKTSVPFSLSFDQFRKYIGYKKTPSLTLILQLNHHFFTYMCHKQNDLLGFYQRKTFRSNFIHLYSIIFSTDYFLIWEEKTQQTEKLCFNNICGWSFLYPSQ